MVQARFCLQPNEQFHEKWFLNDEDVGHGIYGGANL